MLAYQTDPLGQDLTLAGPVEASLWVSTTGTDADFIIKLVDVYPENYPDPQPNPHRVCMGGFQQLIRAEAFRGKFRNSYELPEPFQPGKPTHMRFSLLDVSHTFRAGHRFMVQVQSTWFPLVDRNPQTFVDIYTASASDFRLADLSPLPNGRDAVGSYPYSAGETAPTGMSALAAPPVARKRRAAASTRQRGFDDGSV